MAEFEESRHYVGKDAEGNDTTAIVRFYPGMHGYFVTDPVLGVKNKRTGGGTSLTGTMAKGQGLMLWPMWEMNKHLKNFFDANTFADLIDDPDITIESILKAGRDAHTKKSDRGKNVGTDAHAWVEAWSRALMLAQDEGVEFVEPEIPEVQEIVTVLRASYIRLINTVKPKLVEQWKTLPKLLMKEIDMQEAIYTEAKMVRQSILGAKAWLDKHTIYVHGAEDTVYSRLMFICGKYDSDWSVTCSEKCGWCYLNSNEEKLAHTLVAHSKTIPDPKMDAAAVIKLLGKDSDYKFTARYITDFKSTNASQECPKGIYPEYLAQCGVYDTAIVEEHPDRKYDGHLILNGSKVPFVDKKSGTEYPLFNTHFSMNRDRNIKWAHTLADLKEYMWQANAEMKESNAGIKVPKKASS